MKTLLDRIRRVPDFPKPDIQFFDITTLLAHPGGLRATIDALTERVAGLVVDRVVGIESRGFFFAPQIAYALHAGFVPMRKPGKLPSATVSASYDLEYGDDALHVHTDAIQEGDRVLIIDDVLATGGTAEAARRLVASCGGHLVGFVFLLEIEGLDGRGRLERSLVPASRGADPTAAPPREGVRIESLIRA